MVGTVSLRSVLGFGFTRYGAAGLDGDAVGHAAPPDPEAQGAPPGGEMRIERGPAADEAGAGEAEHDGLPEAAERRGMHAAGGVPHVVGEVDLGRLTEVALGGREVPEAAGEERVDRGAERAAVRSEEHTSELQSREN